jgi:phosphohistidine phosphatase SixA
MKRRIVLAALGAGAYSTVLPAGAAENLAPLLRKGGCAVVIRHATTEPGIGDPPNFRLDQCSTQRNLSAGGREQSRQIGAWFKAQQLQPREVYASAWCRCKDTAQLAFGRATVLAALNSTFRDRSRQEAQTATLRTLLPRIPAASFEVWVSHQVNISSLTGQGTSMGEMLVVGPGGGILGRALLG